jgi:aldose 1-epimerase
MGWGCYPMVPFAGRIRAGRFGFQGKEVVLPANLGPHAIHGFGFIRPWEITGPARIGFQLGDPWPWKGRVEQRFRLEPGCFHLELELHAEQTMPAMLGWHPWFRRELSRGGALRLGFPAARMYERDGAGIPTGRLVPPPPGPWDDCFTGLSGPQSAAPDVFNREPALVKAGESLSLAFEIRWSG